MLLGNRYPRPSTSRRRGAYRPAGEGLEDRVVPTGFTVDLAGIAGNTANNVAPLGVQLVGAQNASLTGSEVAYLGDVNGDGFDDFFVGAQNLNTAYLVFGSNDVSVGTVNWLTLNTQQRIGDLAFLTNLNQTNPINGQPGFSFNGVVFTALDSAALVGANASGVGDVNGDQINDFIIGAPNADGGVGRAFLIYGGTQLNGRGGTPIAIDATPAQLNLAIFSNAIGSTPTQVVGAGTGASVSSAGDLITDGLIDLAIGAPGTSFNGLPASGAVYVVSGTFLRTSPLGLVNLQLVGQLGTGAIAGALLTGSGVGDQAGFALASAGNVDGTTIGSQPTGDLLIGAPAAGVGAGSAYLVYGANNLASFATTTSNITRISLSQVGLTTTTGVPGAIFTGGAGGDLTGFAVSGAGDFNADGLSDILIGAPGFGGGAGRINLIYGRAASPNPPGPLTGTIPLGTLPTSVLAAQLNGAAPGNQAGFSLSAVGRLSNTNATPGILIGAPGFLLGRGTAYLIPANAGLLGGLSLANATADPISATQFTTTVLGAGLGTSVSGRLTPTSVGRTLDTDLLGDFLLGAPGFSIATTTTTRQGAGAVFALEGAFVPVGTPAQAGIVTQIGVDTAFAPFIVNLSLTTPLDIFVFSTSTFRPLTDIDPTRVLVNNTFAFGPITLVNAGDLNGDGINDARFQIARSGLTLPAGNQTFTVSGTTLATSPLGVQIWAGSATVNVTSPPAPPGPPPPSGAPPSIDIFFGGVNSAVPRFGEALVPTVSTLSRLNYRPIPFSTAFRQFRPTEPFATRQHNFFNPQDIRRYKAGYDDEQRGISTLPSEVFHRGLLDRNDHSYRYVHEVPVIPRYLQAEGTVSPQFRRGTQYRR